MADKINEPGNVVKGPIKPAQGFDSIPADDSLRVADGSVVPIRLMKISRGTPVIIKPERGKGPFF
jgi:hypothetical protein